MPGLFFEKPVLPELREEYNLVDMHFHTEYSADSTTKISDILKLASKKGVGLAITDHNETKGSLLALKQKKVLVIPGVEITTKNDKDILLYFYSKGDLESFHNKIIKNHVTKHKRFRFNKLNLSTEHILESARDHNAFVSVAHPFIMLPKKSFYYFNNKKNQYLLDMVDSIEVLNSAMKRKANLASAGWALSLNKCFTGGSDGHRLKWLGNTLTGCKADNVEDFIDFIKKKKNIVIGEELKLSSKIVSDIIGLKVRI